MWLFAETQKEMWLLVSEWLATPDLNYKDLKRANHKELKSRATYTAVYKWMRCFTYSILQFELYLLAKGNCFSGSVIRI